MCKTLLDSITVLFSSSLPYSKRCKFLTSQRRTDWWRHIFISQSVNKMMRRGGDLGINDPLLLNCRHCTGFPLGFLTELLRDAKFCFHIGIKLKKRNNYMSSFLRKRAEMALYNVLYGSLWGIGNLESICELMSHRSSLKCWQNYSIVTKEW